MLSSAALIQRPSAFERMSAANSVPVPIGLVKISASPDFIPPFRMSVPRSATPWTENPNASSAPSQLWPPASAQPTSLRTDVAPDII
eukprot:30937-Pelagococcus_subviridis.AAC.22